MFKLYLVMKNHEISVQISCKYIEEKCAVRFGIFSDVILIEKRIKKLEKALNWIQKDALVFYSPDLMLFYSLYMTFIVFIIYYLCLPINPNVNYPTSPRAIYVLHYNILLKGLSICTHGVKLILINDKKF